MSTFTYSSPQNGSNFAFNVSVTGTLQSFTQPNASNNPVSSTGYVLTSATGTINGESVTLYTGGAQFLYDEYKIGNFTYNNIVKISTPGDGGGTVVSGLDFSGLMFQSSTSLYNLFYSGGSFEIDKTTLAGVQQSASFYTPVVLTSTAPCYVTGTRLLTDRGETAIQDLAVGDRLLTLSGEARPVIWIGRKTVVCAAHPSPDDVLPVCLRKDALAPGLPTRDLFVSPWHALHFDGALIPAQSLVNGATITREAVACVTYWHVELETHDVVFAEGVQAETYYAASNRHLFEGERRRDEPMAAPCLPVLNGGERVEAVRRYLWERARAMGGRVIDDPGLQVVADGEVLTPQSAAEGRYFYRVPQGTARLRLRSQAARPDEVLTGIVDSRRLGVHVVALALDGTPVAWDDETFRDGWHEPESEAPDRRWTTGDAALPLGRELALQVAPMPHYGLRLPSRPAPVLPAAAPAVGNVIRFATSRAAS